MRLIASLLTKIITKIKLIMESQRIKLIRKIMHPNVCQKRWLAYRRRRWCNISIMKISWRKQIRQLIIHRCLAVMLAILSVKILISTKWVVTSQRCHLLMETSNFVKVSKQICDSMSLKPHDLSLITLEMRWLQQILSFNTSKNLCIGGKVIHLFSQVSKI